MNWKTKTTLWLLLAAAVVVGSSIAQNALDNPTRDLIDRLIETSSDAWLDTGTVKVMHTAYKAPRITDPKELEQRIQQEIQAYKDNPNKPHSTPEMQALWIEALPSYVRYNYANESTTVTQEVIRFDGDLFLDEVTLLSHTDSVQPEPSLASNPFSPGPVNLDINRKQVIAYDGQRFAQYFESAHKAIEKDSLGPPEKPRALSVGIMPWGDGPYNRDNLLKGRPSTSTEVIDGKQRTRLTLTLDTGIHLDIVLDPDTLAMYQRTITWANGAILNTELSNHVEINGRWVPTDIYEEQLAPEDSGYRQVTWDMWHLDIVSTEQPQIEYIPDYQEGDKIQYSSPLSKSSQRYEYHYSADTDALLTKRLNTLAAQKTGTSNCATLAIQEAASRLDRPLTGSLDFLIDENGFTSLAAMQQFLQEQGFHCKAIRTTIEHLVEDSTHNETILYLPDKRHFVLLDTIDIEKIWIIDLTSDTFYKSTPINIFAQRWTNGIALLVSKEPIQSDEFVLSDTELRSTLGATGWSCSLQVGWYYTYGSCLVPPCDGYVWQFFNLWRCAEAPSGNCTEVDYFIKWVRYNCVPNSYGSCDITGVGALVQLGTGCDGELY